MQVIKCGSHEIFISSCFSKSALRENIASLLANHQLFPRLPKEASILLKPNLNNDLLALTGNSTDLRVLAALIQVLQEQGYTNITIADGPNIGIYRKSINVFNRLGVEALARHFGVQLVDLNSAPFKRVKLAAGTIRVPEICLQSDYFISIPKIKTHVETGLSAAVKNLMGCVVGTDKRLIHADLSYNLVRLNEIIKPDLILVKKHFDKSKSNSELRRLFKQGAVSLNDRKISAFDEKVDVASEDVVKVGKRTWFKVRVEEK